MLSKKEDKVSLIMDKNICEDGTTNYTEQNGYCNYSWHDDNDIDIKNDTNNYGPDTAMTVLYNATKDWTNVPDMIMDYTDEHNTDSTINGYTSIITDTNTKVTTITGKNGVQNTMIGTSANPLKARMLKLSEAEAVGCGWDEATCSIWLGDNLVNADSCANLGYWILSSVPDDSKYVFIITATDELADLHDFLTSGINGYHYNKLYGIRPVITISITDLAN